MRTTLVMAYSVSSSPPMHFLRNALICYKKLKVDVNRKCNEAFVAASADALTGAGRLTMPKLYPIMKDELMHITKVANIN